jgi:hypothetical protein
VALTKSKHVKVHKPQRKVTEIEYRRSLIAPLLLQGADNATILRSLLNHKDPTSKEAAPIQLSLRQLIEDRKAIDAELAEFFRAERPNAGAKHYASLLNRQMQLQDTANEARSAGKLYARV